VKAVFHAREPTPIQARVNALVDAYTCTFAVLWNAFKRLAAGASKEEKTALFCGTATRIYRLEF
jgi:predicted TIM-barrel fold metal-dependent hydrolase